MRKVIEHGAVGEQFLCRLDAGRDTRRELLAPTLQLQKMIQLRECCHVVTSQAMAAPSGRCSLLSWRCFARSCWLFLGHSHSFACGSSLSINEEIIRERST